LGKGDGLGKRETGWGGKRVWGRDMGLEKVMGLLREIRLGMGDGFGEGDGV